MAMTKDERRELNKVSQKKWYAKNKEYSIKRQREKRWAMKEWFEKEILANCKCEKCGENHPGVLDFHHIDPSTKEGNVGLMVYQKYSKKKTLAEIAKCQVLCANCHRKHHWEERKTHADGEVVSRSADYRKSEVRSLGGLPNNIAGAGALWVS